jgi:hypothetical protein
MSRNQANSSTWSLSLWERLGEGSFFFFLTHPREPPPPNPCPRMIPNSPSLVGRCQGRVRHSQYQTKGTTKVGPIPGPRIHAALRKRVRNIPLRVGLLLSALDDSPWPKQHPDVHARQNRSGQVLRLLDANARSCSGLGTTILPIAPRILLHALAMRQGMSRRQASLRSNKSRKG